MTALTLILTLNPNLMILLWKCLPR